jgi:hypothetical protein
MLGLTDSIILFLSITINFIKMKSTLSLYLFFIMFFCHAQELEYFQLNKNTVDEFLLKDGFTLKNPVVDNNGYKIYSSIKESKGSYTTISIYFYNECPVMCEKIITGYVRKDGQFKDIDEVTMKVYKSLYEGFKKKYVDFEKISDTEFITKPMIFDDYNEVIFQAKYGEDENNIFISRKDMVLINFENIPNFRLLGSNQINILDVSTYNLEDMVKYFLKDLDYYITEKYGEAELNNTSNINKFDREKIMQLLDKMKKMKINVSFEEMNTEILAVSLGINDDNNIIIKANPIKWRKSSNQEKWYIIYHELGHDILNFIHGQGDKMMFNFIEKNYTWKEFFYDRKKMFDVYINENLIRK